MLLIYPQVYGHQLEHSRHIRDPTGKENQRSPSWHPLIANGFLTKHGYWWATSLYAGRLTGLIFWSSCKGNYNCCEFLNAMNLSYSQDTHFLQSFDLWSQNLFTPSSRMVLESWEEAVIEVLFRVEYSSDTYSLPFDRFWIFILIAYCLLQKEAYLMRTESCTYLWEQRHGFRKEFDIVFL